MVWHAVTSALTSFSFYQDTDQPKGIKFLKKPNLKIIRNNMKSQIQNKKNGGIMELLIPILNKIMKNQGTYFVAVMNNRLKIISVRGATL